MSDQQNITAQKAKQEAEALKAKQEAEARAKQEDEVKAKQEAEARAKQEAEARANDPGANDPRTNDFVDPREQAQIEADSIVKEAEAKADAILARAKNTATAGSKTRRGRNDYGGTVTYVPSQDRHMNAGGKTIANKKSAEDNEE